MTLLVFGLATASALLCAALVLALRPLLLRYALARPNARSSHRTPTPQGGGIAVVATTLALGTAGVAAGAPAVLPHVVLLGAAALALALVGAIDDIRPLPTGPRLVLQLAAVAAVVVFAGNGPRLFPAAVPAMAERVLLVLAGAWFVNLVNFMDGLDWMTVAEVVPITACLALLGLAGALPPAAAVMAAALFGAMLGFAPFNRPVAGLFLGDVGSLPIGLLLGWMLLELAGAGALAAALLLPLYYLADATLTLMRRLTRGERVWEAHRSHFYQRATDNGLPVPAIVGSVFGLNITLAALAAATLAWPAWPVEAGALLLGALLVALVLRRFSTPGPIRSLA